MERKTVEIGTQASGKKQPNKSSTSNPPLSLQSYLNTAFSTDEEEYVYPDTCRLPLADLLNLDLWYFCL